MMSLVCVEVEAGMIGDEVSWDVAFSRPGAYLGPQSGERIIIFSQIN